MQSPPDADPPALALVLMGELQRYRAHGGPIDPVARRFVEALADADDAGISPAVLERLAMLAQAPGPLDDADQRWIRTQLPEIVRRLALASPAPASSGSCRISTTPASAEALTVPQETLQPCPPAVPAGHGAAYGRPAAPCAA